MFYFIEPIFWLKLILAIVITALAFYIFGFLMRKWLKVEKKKLFSHNHVNDMHKKIDWMLRIIFIAFIIVGAFYNAERGFSDRIWFLEPWSLLIGLTILTEAVRAFMEWKYAANKNYYIFTLSQLAFGLLLVYTTISTNFFGMV